MRTLFEIDQSINAIRERYLAGDEDAQILMDILLDERLEVMKHDEDTETEV